MRQAITNLCKQQNQHLQRLISHHNLDAKTSSKTQKYYRQLRKLNHLFDHQGMEDLMRTAIVIAEKAQVVYTITGERVKGLALSLNEMVREGTSLTQLLILLRAFLAHSKVIDPELRNDLAQLIQELAFGVSFLQKFQRAMQYFDFDDLTQQNGYREQFKAFTWVLFLQARQSLNIESQFESDYLLIAVLYLTVRHAFDYLRPKHAPQLSGSRASQKNLVSSILHRLFQVFLIDDLASFKQITTRVDDYFESLINLAVIRCTNDQTFDFLNPALLPLNYRRLDLLYQRQRPPHSLDYRFLLPQRPHTLTPRRFSQLSQKRAGGEKRKGFKQKTFASHKILTFEPQAQSTTTNEDSQRLQQQIKLPANVKVSPSNTRTPMLFAFRQSPCSPIENYMHREVRQGKVGSMGAEEDEILCCIRDILSNYCNVGLQEKVNLAYNYYVVLTEKYFRQVGICEEGESQHHYSSLLAYSILIMICSLAESAVDAQRVRIGLSSIRQMIITNGYYLWLTNNFFLRIADRLPSQLRELANIMQDIILNQLIWQQGDISAEIIQMYHAPCENSIRSKNVLALMQKILNKLQNHVIRLMAEFNTIDNCDKIESDIDKTVKYLLLHIPEITKDRNLLTILLCSTYLVFRTNGFSIKFNEIVTTFQQINRLRSAQYKRFVNEIEVQAQDAILYFNIIEFYNKLFLPEVKEHLNQIQCWIYEPPEASNQRQRQRQNKSSKQSQRYSFQSLKENHPKRHTLTEQPLKDRKEIRRLQSETSPNHAQIELNTIKQKSEDVNSAARNETTMRSRPITSFLGCLNTQKIKSPTIIR